MIFSKLTLKCLKKAKWKENYMYDTAEFEKLSKEEGHKPNTIVLSFLKKYGNLRIIHPHHLLKKAKDSFHLNPIKGIESIYIERVETYEKKINDKLITIGEAYDEGMTLLMSLAGKVYAALDDLLIFIANSGEEAINNLCEGKDTIEIK